MIGYDPDRHFARIGGGTQVFLDDEMIAWVQNVKRTFHKAEPHAANPLIAKDRPWEEMPYFTTCYSVIRDDDGLFKVWYSDFIVSPPCERPFPFYTPPAWSSRLCYAPRMESSSTSPLWDRSKSAVKLRISCTGKRMWIRGSPAL